MASDVEQLSHTLKTLQKRLRVSEQEAWTCLLPSQWTPTMTWPLETSSCTCWRDTSPCCRMSLAQKTFVLSCLTASCSPLSPGEFSHSSLITLYWRHKCNRIIVSPLRLFNMIPILSASKENVHRHILRMLVHLHHKVAPSYMESLMKTLEPPKQVSWMHEFISFWHTHTHADLQLLE